MKPQDRNYCPYKEYWFGPGEEAQAKPAGFKFQRGTLLKVKSGYMTGYRSLEGGAQMSMPLGITEDSVVFLLGYDSNIVTIKVTDLFTYKSEPVEAIEHKFSFLYDEKIQIFVLSTWGRWYQDRHNEMWIKARKPRKPPVKKRKTRAKGFSFD